MKYNAPFGSVDPNASFVDRNSPGAVSGSRVPAAAVEQVQREMVNFITKSGQTPNGSDLLQMTKADRSQALNRFAAAGTPNAIVVAMDPAPASWAELAGTPLRVLIATPNTLRDVTFAPAGLSVLPITYNDGSLPQPLDLSGWVELIPNPAAGRVEISSMSRGSILSMRRSQLVASRGASSQNLPTGTGIRITNYGDIASYFDGGSTFSAGVLTIGAGDAGLWFISGHCRQTFASTSGMAVSLHLNNDVTPTVSDGGSVAATGGTAVAHGSASRILTLTSGTTVEMRIVQTTGADFLFSDLYSFTATRLGAA